MTAKLNIISEDEDLIIFRIPGRLGIFTAEVSDIIFTSFNCLNGITSLIISNDKGYEKAELPCLESEIKLNRETLLEALRNQELI